MKSTQVRELAQGIEACVSYRCSSEFSLDYKWRKPLEAGKLCIVEFGSNINGSENQAVGWLCGNRDQFCTPRSLHLENLIHQRAVVSHRLGQQVSGSCGCGNTWNHGRRRGSAGLNPRAEC